MPGTTVPESKVMSLLVVQTNVSKSRRPISRNYERIAISTARDGSTSPYVVWPQKPRTFGTAMKSVMVYGRTSLPRRQTLLRISIRASRRLKAQSRCLADQLLCAATAR